jgi:hypothetical protein
MVGSRSRSRRRSARGTGTSPALSHDGKRLYAFEGDGSLIAVDAATGAILYSRSVGGVPASPSAAPGGEVYLLARERLVKVDGPTGEILWERTYHDFAKERLPSVSRLWPFVKTGEPEAAINSVVTITGSVVWTSLSLGWTLDLFGTEFFHPRACYLVALDPATGDLLAAYGLPDTSEGGISVGPGGELYLDMLAVQASLAAGAPYRWFLPAAMRMPRARGGIVAFRPTAGDSVGDPGASPDRIDGPESADGARSLDEQPRVALPNSDAGRDGPRLRADRKIAGWQGPESARD